MIKIPKTNYKKIILISIILVIAGYIIYFVYGCNVPGKTDKAKIDYGYSEKFNNQEIESAVVLYP